MAKPSDCQDVDITLQRPVRAEPRVLPQYEFRDGLDAVRPAESARRA